MIKRINVALLSLVMLATFILPGVALAADSNAQTGGTAHWACELSTARLQQIRRQNVILYNWILNYRRHNCEASSNCGLAVRLSSSTPAAQTVVPGEEDVKVMRLEFTTREQAVHVDRLIVQADGDFENWYLENFSLVNNSGVVADYDPGVTNPAVFSEGFMVPAYTRASYALTVDVNQQAELDTSFKAFISNPGSVEATCSNSGNAARIIGDFPVISQPVTIGNGQPSLTLSADTPSGVQTSGHQDIFRFQIAASNEDLLFESATFQVYGDRQLIYGPVELRDQSGLVLDTAYPTSDGYLEFQNFDYAYIAEHQTEHFSLHAFINDRNLAEDNIIQVVVEQPEDIQLATRTSGITLHPTGEFPLKGNYLIY